MSVTLLHSAQSAMGAEPGNRLANALKELKAFNDAVKPGAFALQQALLDVKNEANDLEQRIGHARADVAGERSALRKLLASVSHLPAGAGLRIKGGELKPMKSRNVIKERLGYDKAKRERQAYQLQALYGRTTCGGLRELQKEKASVDASIVSTQFEQKLTASLLEAMTKAETHRQVEGWRLPGAARTLDTRAVLELIRQSAVGAALESTRPVDLGKMIDRYCKSIEVDHMEYRTALERMLRADRDSAQTALQEHERQLLVDARSGLVKDLVPADFQQRAADSRRHQDALSKEMGDLFGAVVKTSAGCKGVHQVWDRTIPAVDGKKVIREINDRLGEGTFGKGAAEQGKALRYYADVIDRPKLERIFMHNWKLKLNEFADGVPTIQTHRRVGQTEDTINALRKLAQSSGRVRPKQLLYSARHKEDTQKYPMGGLGNLLNLDLEITSFSSLQVGTKYPFAGEHRPDYLITPYSAFVVKSVERNADGWVARLQEVPVNAEQLQSAQRLKL